jgi:hypothetical protein
MKHVTEIVCESNKFFVVRNGVKIAVRGDPWTRHAKMWVPLEPGWLVRSPEDLSTIEIEYTGDGAVAI